MRDTFGDEVAVRCTFTESCGVRLHRKRVYKAPTAEEDPFGAPQPGSLGSLSFPEFGYVLRARQAAARAAQQAQRSQREDAWAGGAMDADGAMDAQQLEDDDGNGAPMAVFVRPRRTGLWHCEDWH